MRDARIPTSDPFSIAGCRAPQMPAAQAFQGGLIEWGATTGAHVLLPGNIWNRFAAMQGHCGPAGLPVTDAFDWPGQETIWRAQVFEYRAIFEHKPTGQTFVSTADGKCG